MNKLKKYFGVLFKNIYFCLKSCFNASKKYMTMKIIVLLLQSAIPLLTITLWRDIINLIVEDVAKNRYLILMYLSVFLTLELMVSFLEKIDNYVNLRYNDELTFYIESEMMDKCSKMDLSFWDSASMGDKIRQTRSNFDVLNNTTWVVFNVISTIINIVVAFVFVTLYNVWIAIACLVLIIPYMLYNNRHFKIRYNLEIAQQRDNRKMGFYFGAMTDNQMQFEMKLNGIGSYFLNKYNEIWRKLYKINKSEDTRYNIINAIIILIYSCIDGVVVIFSINDVINKAIAIGDLQYNLNIVMRLRSQCMDLTNFINQLLINNDRILNLQEFINMKPKKEKSGNLIPTANPEIEFCNVSFCYPNSSNFVLKNCSFLIRPHEKVGLIGSNGAGKSTIIKLLFRFYDPQEGQIKIDGTDIKEYDIYALRKIFGVLFQDYVTYCIPLREIIALPDFEKRFDDEKLKKACDISGVNDIIKNWENGYNSVLGRYYADNGKDLSGGQWQLVGLARAYFKECQYMILDEPSASLDPISEDRIFEQLYFLSKDKTSITISHRLSNTTLASKLLVIDEGHIVEQGTHRELLKQNGKYAYLFNLQAKNYQ